MKINLKLILPAGAALLAVLLFAVGWPFHNEHAPHPPAGQSRPEKQQANSSTENQIENIRPEQNSDGLDPQLQAVLNERDPARRRELLEQWIKSVDVNALPDTLVRMDAIQDGQLKFEIRAALLKSWSARDLGGEVKWFGDRGGADGLHQQTRDELARAMGEREPRTMLEWMDKSMPASGKTELYIPLCQQWMSRDPAGTAALLREKISPSTPGADAANPAWVDLAGQVAAQWAHSDVNSAVNWAQSLPPGAARSRALELVSYQWTESSPQAAAAYAARENDPKLARNVAAKWAESDPQAAGTWARGLPQGEAGAAAILSLVPMWTQKDPVAAATYATSLSQEDVRNQAILAVVSAWAENDPDQARAWVGQFPVGPVREKAMEQIKLIVGK